MPISAEEMSAYRATARQQQVLDHQKSTARYRRAWDLARQAAMVLREQFGVKRVMAFGSLAKEELFHSRSDIDLAVWGMDEKEYYRAVAHLLTLDQDFSMDLIAVEDAPVSLRERIENEGIPV
ncbi:MAG: nucleotidyltransferase domain-containing protein [Pseudomonadota bacterium]